jgi:DNA uptake protein ComE-like DNA-binding protein
MIRRILRTYLSLTRGERNGFFVLILIIIILLLGRILMPGIVPASIPDFKGAEEDFRKFRNALQESESSNPERPGTESAIQLFNFDPNTISYEELLKLGLSSKVARILQNYRKSGGIFYSKPDLQKVYGLSEADFNRLEPYISIESVKRDRNIAVPTNLAPDENIERKIIAFELNSSDTAQLQGINGIGPVFANRIVKYRDMLGGYYHREQLMEVYGLKEQQYDEIIKHIFIDTSSLRRINLNTAEREILSGHPYLSAYQADAIIAYRDYKGVVEDIHEIVLNELLPDTVYERIRPYIRIGR